MSARSNTAKFQSLPPRAFPGGKPAPPPKTDPDHPAYRNSIDEEAEPTIDGQTERQSGNTYDRSVPNKPKRLVSLDAFRGLTILGMLTVNNIALGDKAPQQVLHGEWSGAVNMADLVFPWFLFIVGVALPYSVASARRKKLDLWHYDLKALWRAMALVALGCLIDSFEMHRPVFDLDVLQLIGLAFFTAVLVGGLLRLPGRLILAGLLLLANWAIIRKVPIPGYGSGHFTEQLNTIDYINKQYLNPVHLKGLLSVIPTTALVLIGTAVGDLIRRKKISPLAKIGTLAVCGGGMIAAGWIWSSHELGAFSLPMNKPCWTASYILFCGGWACIGLAIMYGLIDATPGKWGARLSFPLLVFGSNAIVAYVAPILTKVAILSNIHTTGSNGQRMDLVTALISWFHTHYGQINGGWAYTATYIAFWWCILLVLYKKRWFLRV